MEQQSVFLYNLHFGVYEKYTEEDSIQVYRHKKPVAYSVVFNDEIRTYHAPRNFWLAMQSLFKKYGDFEYTQLKELPQDDI